MKFKSAKEMKLRAYKEKYKITKEQKEWIDEFKKLVKDKLDEAYDKTPNLGEIKVSKYIDITLVYNVDTEEFFTQIEHIKDHLNELGYSLSEERSYSITGLIDGYRLYIKWELPQ